MAVSEESAKDLGAENMGKRTIKDKSEPKEWYRMKQYNTMEKNIEEDIKNWDRPLPEMPSSDYCEGAAAVVELLQSYFGEKPDCSLTNEEGEDLLMKLDEIAEMAFARRRLRLLQCTDMKLLTSWIGITEEVRTSKSGGAFPVDH